MMLMIMMIRMIRKTNSRRLPTEKKLESPKDVALKVKKQEATVDVPTEGDNTAPADIEDFNDATAPKAVTRLVLKLLTMQQPQQAVTRLALKVLTMQQLQQAVTRLVVKVPTMQQPQQAATRLVVKILAAHLG